MTKLHRGVQRTREMLQKALMELINEQGYDSITIQEIVDRANVGRTTFYLHYDSKDELFLSCHEAITRNFHLGEHHQLSKEEWLSLEAPPGMVSAFRHLEDARALLYPIFQGKESTLVMRRIRDKSAQDIETSLRAAFNEADSAISLELLANYLAGARLAMVQWTLEKRQPYSFEELAQTFHRMQRAAIRDAFGLCEEKS
ncbi:MAG: TetR/AcrR family transcriptional regulator [Anaerolineae bacterium]|nr:TetR/AcrR family transcriptional regulator [Anaerolineae bacterium]